MELNREQKRSLAIAGFVIYALGCFFLGVGATQIGVALLAIFLLGSVCGAVYIVFILVSRGVALIRK